MGDKLNGKGALERELKNLEVYCPINKKKGCNWKGLRDDVYSHIVSCDKAFVSCYYGCGNAFVNINHLDTCENIISWSKQHRENSIDMKTKICIDYLVYSSEIIGLYY